MIWDALTPTPSAIPVLHNHIPVILLQAVATGLSPSTQLLRSICSQSSASSAHWSTAVCPKLLSCYLQLSSWPSLTLLAPCYHVAVALAPVIQLRHLPPIASPINRPSLTHVRGSQEEQLHEVELQWGVLHCHRGCNTLWLLEELHCMRRTCIGLMLCVLACLWMSALMKTEPGSSSSCRQSSSLCSSSSSPHGIAL